ncbi:MAG: YigZ family protein [Planctomycetes bacterium]|jgi:uncharacterized YigZ family protein|nr:YigZ family protein [Planctomycetota bacterium]HNZ65740.1 YigZ family protein [Planctomycetota bacterium]HPY74698.1 YigZ family protein [Planctomycetota bacterium]HQB00269.1 YigZ family protein [Planctomycetota bacterium]
MAKFYFINQTQEVTYKVERSEFIAYLVYVDSVEQAKEEISTRSKKMYRATHNCWAYIVGDEGELFHCSDAGEPSGTAGLPILRVLQKYNLTNIATIVTRYFGGVKLGVRGLIDAYSQVVELAIQPEQLLPLIKLFSCKIKVHYSQLDYLKYQLQQLQVTIDHAEYTDSVLLHVSVDIENTFAVEFLQSQCTEI